jgi:KDO2-lipid IV(A) lauroyltransferase
MTRLFKILAHMPLWLMHGLGWCLGWGVFLASGVYRRRFLINARQAGFGWRQWRGAVGEAGKLVSELPRLWFGAPLPIEWHGAQLIDQALAQGRGVVFLTPHMGCFEVTAQGYARKFGPQWQAITVLFRPARQAWLREVVEQARQRPGLATAPTTLAGVKQMMKALKAGQAIGLLPDQVPPLGMGLWTPFFGKPAYTMTLAARLAQQTGAQILLAWGERLAWGRGFKLHLSAMERPLSDQIDEAVRQINQAMERLIAQCPSQYLWGYARYKAPREER